jgi:hypothetical protein
LDLWTVHMTEKNKKKLSSFWSGNIEIVIGVAIGLAYRYLTDLAVIRYPEVNVGFAQVPTRVLQYASLLLLLALILIGHNLIRAWLIRKGYLPPAEEIKQ